mgnify:CR=1 FL=1|tara:strand:- start:478 stop:900 length:423 start_codon:yes stop_codon:yes gene_type:complete
MGQNSTEVAYQFGQFGSTYLTGDGAKLLLTAATAKYYVCAITMTEATKFQALEVLEGGVDLGMGDTYFVATDGPYTLDTDWAGTTGTETTAETNEDSDQVTTSHVFPSGITIYGMWDNVELHEGACIVYVAPRHDYMHRA